MSISIPIPAEATTGANIVLPAMHKLTKSAFVLIFIPYSF
jgi:hypothetical protein